MNFDKLEQDSCILEFAFSGWCIFIWNNHVWNNSKDRRRPRHHAKNISKYSDTQHIRLPVIAVQFNTSFNCWWYFQRFGVDYIAFCGKVEYCPLDFLRLAFTCCQVRANFCYLKKSYKFYTVNLVCFLDKNILFYCNMQKYMWAWKIG
jgi:hypothetical protein